MATVTNTGHVNNAIRLTQNVGNIYIGIGGTNEWATPSMPPEEDPTTIQLGTIIGMKKADTVSLARLIPDTENFTGSYIQYAGKKYELVSQRDAYKKDAHFVYVKATIEPGDLPTGSYRTVGMFTSPKFATGVTGDVIPAESIVSQGSLEMFENRVALDRTNLKINEQFIIEA